MYSSAPEAVTMRTYGCISRTGCNPNTVCLMGVESSQDGASGGVSVRQVGSVPNVMSHGQLWV